MAELNEKKVSVLELERSMNMNIKRVQLEFVKKLYDERGGNIVDLLNTFSTAIFYNEIEHPTKKEVKIIQEESEQIIREIPVDDKWIESVYGVLTSMTEKIQKLKEDKADELDKFGPFTGQLVSADQVMSERVGLEIGDAYLDIHFPEAAVSLAKGEGIKSPKKGMKDIANYVLNVHPEIKAVVGRSWLISHTITTNLGFKKTYDPLESGSKEEQDKVFQLSAYWLQLLDKHGNIKQDVVDHLMENGRLPYNYAIGKIDVIDLLKKYSDVSGEVELKKLKPEYRNLELDMKREGEQFVKLWPTLSPDDVEDAVRSTLLWATQAMDEMEIIDEVISLLQQEREKRSSIKDMEKNEDLMDKISSARTYLESNRYINEIVVI